MGNRGKPPIPDFQQARILAKKMSHSDTQQNIALEENVSRSSVIRITPESVKPEVLAMAQDFKAEIVEKAKRNVRDGLDEMHVRMFTSKAKLSEVTGAVKISHDILQLQTGQATSIVQDQATMLSKLVDFCKLQAEDARELAAMVLYADGSGIDESLRRAEAERILAESVKVDNSVDISVDNSVDS